MILKADPKYVDYDYQWYEGTYHGSPIFYVFIGFAPSGESEIFSSHHGGPQYSESEKSGKEIVDEVKEFLHKRR